MVKKTIDCENCGFLGKLTFKNDMFEWADVIICPVCGADVSEDEPEDEDEAEEEE